MPLWLLERSVRGLEAEAGFFLPHHVLSARHRNVEFPPQRTRRHFECSAAGEDYRTRLLDRRRELQGLLSLSSQDATGAARSLPVQ